MNLSKQLKKYRERDQLSQADLAEKIYVSRQTISNWENERSYPDIHNLLLLSVLFDVTLDELVKGDVEMMKNNMDTNEMNKLSWVMGIFAALACISIPPTLKFLDLWGLIIPAVLYAICAVAAFKIEKLKKKNDVKTYAEIVAFMENKDVDEARKLRDRKRDIRNKALIVLSFGAAALILTLLSAFIFGI